jgi:hypothetical protein
MNSVQEGECTMTETIRERFGPAVAEIVRLSLRALLDDTQ